jgi:REP element-mobilizing transposase RayT
MLNDTEIPLACLITFRGYGTWLHGDARGSIDRHNNAYRSPYIEPNSNWEKYNKASLRSQPVFLNTRVRQAVDEAIREVCEVRNWSLYALNIRTNHVHTVVSGADSRAARRLFKTYATRRLKRNGLWEHDHSPWAGKGSRRLLWNERSVQMAIEYVINGQGNDLPNFD